MPGVDFLPMQGPAGPPGDDGVDGPTGPAGPSELVFGSRGGVGTTTTTRYLAPGNSDLIASTTPINQILLATRVIDTITVQHNQAGSGAALLTYTLMLDNVATPITLDMLPTAISELATVSPIVASAGQVASIRVTKPGVITTSPLDIVVSIGQLTE